MAVSRKQLARYRIIDECLQSRMHRPSTSDNPEHLGVWSVEDLIEAIREKGDIEISVRTLKEDISRMRDDPYLGYFAPIETVRGIGYRYAPGEDYRLTEHPLRSAEIEALKEVLEILYQFRGFRYFQDAEGLIHNLEKQINASEGKEIEFDVLPGYMGLENIRPLKKAIHDRTVVRIDYQAFYDDAAVPRHIHPYLLKEYNNRWFVYAYTEEYGSDGVYGLERIRDILPLERKFRHPGPKKIAAYFRDIIGVTNMADRNVEEIVLRLKKDRADYLITKPVHHSQKIIRQDSEHVWFRFRLKVNKELTALILSYGRDALVEKPASLAREVSEHLRQALEQYQDE